MACDFMLGADPLGSEEPLSWAVGRLCCSRLWSFSIILAYKQETDFKQLRDGQGGLHCQMDLTADCLV